MNFLQGHSACGTLVGRRRPDYDPDDEKSQVVGLELHAASYGCAQICGDGDCCSRGGVKTAELVLVALAGAQASQTLSFCGATFVVHGATPLRRPLSLPSFLFLDQLFRQTRLSKSLLGPHAAVGGGKKDNGRCMTLT